MANKRGKRGAKPSKNIREGLKRLETQSAAHSSDRARVQAAAAPRQEQDQPLAEAHVAIALVAEQEKTQTQTQVEARDAIALVAKPDMEEVSEAPLEQAIYEEQEVLPSIEQVANDQFYDDQLVASSQSDVRRPATPMEVDTDEGDERGLESDREVSWSQSPEAHWFPPPPPPPTLPPVPVNQVLSAVQPFGDYCFVLCRTSSQKKDPGPGDTQQQVLRHNQRRESEGDILAQRLAANCPRPFQWQAFRSYCGTRRSFDLTNWFKAESGSSAFVKDIRSILRNFRNKKVTVLVRGVDGISTNPGAIQSFLEFLNSLKIEAQLIFQWNKVCNVIRPIAMRGFTGLGSTTDFMAADFLAHLNKTKFVPEVQRILDILHIVENSKQISQGIQDRNGLPDATLRRAIEVRSIADHHVANVL
jgi:hypothetical protein